MELSKLKLKTEQVAVFNLEQELQVEIEKEFTICDDKSQVIISIVKEEEFEVINKYIDTLDFEQDFLVWICYPKGTSKKYKGIVEVNRNDIHSKINDKVRTVSQVSLDSDWSAMRLRNSKYSTAK